MNDPFDNPLWADAPRPWQVRLLPILLLTTAIGVYFGWARSWNDAPLWSKITFGSVAFLWMAWVIFRYDFLWRRFRSNRKRLDEQRQEMEQVVLEHRARAKSDTGAAELAGEDALER